ncbi:MAG: SGNH/GDSL hydrolase family protein [Streptosporangiaceae bacterium]
MIRRPATVSFLITAVALAACSSQTSARTQQAAYAPPVAHIRGEPDYLALGDSIAFGYRPAPCADYRNQADFSGYPEVLAAALKLNLVNAACPGETSAGMINPSAPSNGCETNARGGPGYRAMFPLHVSYRGAQLSFAVQYLRQHPDTRLVTLGIGANDLFRCQEITADHCGGPDLGPVMAEVTANLDTILGALRNQAHYQHTLVVLSYYAEKYDDPASTGPIEALNAAIAGPAARYGAVLADGFAAFRAAAARAGGDTCAAGLRVKLASGDCDLHPSARGAQVLAAAIQEAIAVPIRR